MSESSITPHDPDMPYLMTYTDKNAKMPSPEEEGQEDTPSPAVPAPPIPPSPSSPSRLSGLLYQPLETVTTVRKAASALHTAGGG